MPKKSIYQVVATKEIHYIVEVEASSITEAEEQVYNKLWSPEHQTLKSYEDWFDVTIGGSECIRSNEFLDEDTEEI